MNARDQALARLAQARRHLMLVVAALALPVLAIAVALAWRLGGVMPSLVLLGVGAVLAAVMARRAATQLDTAWLVRELDTRRRDLEDSSDLLFATPIAAGSLAAMQRSRVEQRLEASPAPDLRAPWPLGRLALAWLAGAAITAALLLWPSPPQAPAPSSEARRPGAISDPGPTRITAASIEITPPAYTGLGQREEPALATKAPQGSMLRWRLRLAPVPAAASLQLHDGQRIALQREGEDWRGEYRLDKSTLYRLVVEGAPALAEDALHRLDAILDRPPQVKVIEPERPLTLLEAGQRTWSLAFEASDDHGLGTARLTLTLAQGSGENISVSERSLALDGVGDGKQRRYSRKLDLVALGFAVGDDLIVRLAVSDNRAPQPQTTRSASFILRWPPETGAEATGMEGLVKRTLPAYFRSQRQIIIDTEALVAERRKLAADVFVERSDLIGVDQRILRLRYGQFLGEETSEEPTVDGEHEEHDDEPGAHAEGSEPAPSIIEQFGHTHDEAEAATLLDPETRALLKSALDNMWRAEEQLRTGQPAAALPYEYKALEFIKRVQQASRIYLARVGLELPPIDESRRLGGDRSGARGRGDALVVASPRDAVVAELWRKLDTGAVSSADLEPLETWVREREADLPDALGLLAASDALRRDPDCDECGSDLRALLWPLLPVPPAAPASRRAADAAGQAYLDALGAEDSR